MKHFFFFLYSGMLAAQAPAEIPDAQPGKCYAKCYLADSVIRHETSYPLFIGDPKTTTGLDSIYYDPFDSSALIVVVKDTTLNKDFIWEVTLVETLVPRQSPHKWLRVLCADHLYPRTIREIQTALQKAGYSTVSLSGELDALTASALRRYQQKRGLPVGNLDMRTLTSLGLAHLLK